MLHSPFTEMDEVAVAVSEDLNLDVTGMRHIPFGEHPVVAEPRQRLALRGLNRIVETVGGLDHTHALPTTAGRSLDEERESDRGELSRIVGRLQNGDARFDRQLLGLLDLVAHGRDRIWRRTDPRNTGGVDRLGERRVFGQEAIAGVNRTGAGCLRGSDDRFGIEVAVDADGLVGLLHEQCVGVGGRENGDRP